MNKLKLSITDILKVSGIGNDFVLLDLRQEGAELQFQKEIGLGSRAEWAKLLCDRYQGLAADGLVILLPRHRESWTWDFYNCDGSHPDMCGNGIRCGMDYLLKTDLASTVEVKTAVGLVKGRITTRNLTGVEFMAPHLIEVFDFQVPETSELVKVWYINSGVPHAVVERDDLEPHARLLPIVKALRFNNKFGDSGANVTFFVRGSKNISAAISFERGVEAFTKGCGTGAMAVGKVFQLIDAQPWHEIVMPGGSLFLDWELDKVILSGNIKYIFAGRLVL